MQKVWLAQSQPIHFHGRMGIRTWLSRILVHHYIHWLHRWFILSLRRMVDYQYFQGIHQTSLSCKAVVRIQGNIHEMLWILKGSCWGQVGFTPELQRATSAITTSQKRDVYFLEAWELPVSLAATVSRWGWGPPANYKPHQERNLPTLLNRGGSVIFGNSAF